MTKARLRILLLSLALLMAAWAAVQHFWLGSHRASMLRLVASSDLADSVPGLQEDLVREPSRNRASQRVARALLSEELGGGNPLDREGGAEAGMERLRLAAELAAQVLARQPASWQAAMVLGGSNYLLASRSRQPATGPQSWRVPLEHARQLAPSQPEPSRLLAAAYIGSWSHLSADTREAATAVVADALRDPQSFELLFPQWQRVAPSLSEALAAVPRLPSSWRAVQQHYVRQLDWERYCLVTRGLYEILEETFEQRLGTAETLFRTGEPERGRRVLLSIPLEAPASRRYAASVETVLARLPGGPVRARYQAAFRGWLDWSLERCLVGDCVFNNRALSRLARLSELSKAHDVAFAALAAGDLERARLYSRSETPGDPAWTPYHLLEARIRLAQRDREGARRALDLVPPQERSRVTYRAIEDLLQPISAPRNSGRSSWRREEWLAEGKHFHLELLVERSGTGLEIEIESVHADGAAVELRWDGAVVDLRALRTPRRLRLDAPVTPGPHRLDLKVLAGRWAVPGPVRLLATDATG